MRGLGRPRPRPGRRSPATTWPHPDAVARGAARARAAARRCPACSSSAPTTTTRRGPKNPLRYLLPDDSKRRPRSRAALARAARRRWPTPAGSTSPTAAATLKVGGRAVELVGVDDPHLGRDRLRPRSPGPPTRRADLRLGVTHSPEPARARRVRRRRLRRWCSPATPTAARCACPASARWSPTATSTGAPGLRWLSRWRPDRTWLHVSAGLGTSPVRAGPLRLPPGGDPAHPGPATDPADRAGSACSARLRSASAGSIGVWRSLVARFVRDEEAAGSNPVTPTLSTRRSRPLLGGVFFISGPVIRLDPVIKESSKTPSTRSTIVRRHVRVDAQRRGHVLVSHDPLHDVRRQAVRETRH